MLKRNENGHQVTTITGLDLTGEQECKRLEDAGYCVGAFAKSCFLSKRTDGYEAVHRLEAGREYSLALVPAKDVPGKPTIAECRTYTALFGYGSRLQVLSRAFANPSPTRRWSKWGSTTSSRSTLPSPILSSTRAC